MTHSTPPPAVVYSFTRFSSAEQSQGDSLRRQTEATKAWCERNGYQLDTTLTLHHVGSAYRGKHRDDKNALGQFLLEVRRGRVPRGSYLVIENLDRLSREDEIKALRLWMDLLDAGVSIVQLSPETIFQHDKIEMPDIMRAIIELSRGHSESRMKSERIGKAWAQRKKRAREDGETITGTLPGWIEMRGGKRCIKPGAKAAIKRIFKLSSRGCGEIRISRLFAQDGVPCFGKTGVWTQAYVRKLLKDRRLLGEHQPRVDVTGEPDGEAIPNYYPAVLTETEWFAAQRDRAGRKPARKEATPVQLQAVSDLYSQGKTVLQIERQLGISRHQAYRALHKLGLKKKPSADKPQGVYLFAKMVKSVGGKQAYVMTTWRSADQPYKVLMLKGKGYATFPYFVFERALLHELNEVDPKDVLGENGHDELKVLEDEYNAIRGEVDSINAFMDAKGFSETLGMRAKKLDDRSKEVAAKLKAAAQKAANPLSATWAEARGILAALDDAADPTDARLRLRSALRRIIAKIEMAVVTRGRERIALVDVEFTGEHAGRFRSLTIWYKPRPRGKWAVASAAGQGKPIEYIPSEEPGEPPIPIPSDWIQQLPAEPKDWFPLPD